MRNKTGDSQIIIKNIIIYGQFFSPSAFIISIFSACAKKDPCRKGFFCLFNSQNSLTYLIFSGFEKLEELCVEEKIRWKNRKLGHSYLFVIPIAQKRTKKGPQKQLDRFFKTPEKKMGKNLNFKNRQKLLQRHSSPSGVFRLKKVS